MDTNQKIALKETATDLVKGASFAVLGAAVTSVTLYVAKKLGATEVEAVLSSVVVLFGGFAVYSLYDSYQYRLAQLRREQSDKA